MASTDNAVEANKPDTTQRKSRIRSGVQAFRVYWETALPNQQTPNQLGAEYNLLPHTSGSRPAILPVASLETPTPAVNTGVVPN